MSSVLGKEKLDFEKLLCEIGSVLPGTNDILKWQSAEWSSGGSLKVQISWKEENLAAGRVPSKPSLQNHPRFYLYFFLTQIRN